MIILKTPPQDSEEWHKLRKLGIGGSDVGAILGLSKYKTRYQVWLEKIADNVVYTEENAKMKAGKRLEPFILNDYLEFTKAKLVQKSVMIQHSEIDYLRGNVDAIVKRDGIERILECKAVFGYAYNHWIGEIPLSYYAQGMFYAEIAGFDTVDFAILKDGWEFKEPLTFERDKEFTKIMMERLAEFWQKNVLERIEPEPLTIQEIQEMYPASATEDYVEADITTAAIVNKYAATTKEIKRLEDEKEELEIEIKKCIGENAGLVIDGELAITWKSNKDSEILDTKALKKDHPQLCEKYTAIKRGARPFKLNKNFFETN